MAFNLFWFPGFCSFSFIAVWLKWSGLLAHRHRWKLYPSDRVRLLSDDSLRWKATATTCVHQHKGNDDWAAIKRLICDKMWIALAQSFALISTKFITFCATIARKTLEKTRNINFQTFTLRGTHLKRARIFKLIIWYMLITFKPKGLF